MSATFKQGAKVIVKDSCTKYKGRYNSQVGVIVESIYDNHHEVGIKIVGLRNPASSKGLFWFKESDLEEYDEIQFSIERPFDDIELEFNAVTTGEALKYALNTCGMYSSDILGDEMKSSYLPKRILKSGNRTIIFWFDDTKTVVKCAEDDNDNVYSAFTAGLAIKIFGNNSRLKKIINESLEYQVKKEKKKPINEFEALGKEMAKLSKNMPKVGMFND